MLLTVDVGNTNTVLGLFDGEHLFESYRIKTDPRVTADELALMFRGLLSGHPAPDGVMRDQPDLVPLVLRAADASAKSTWDAHVAALAAALRAGVVGETSVSGAERLLAAIVSMTPEAVAALVYMLSHEPHSDEGHFVDTTVADDLGISRSRVRVAFRRLEEGGAAEMVGALFDGGEGWVPTEVSQAVLDHLSNAGAT